MICGIGIDSVDIARFNDWSDYPPKKLLKIFSGHEIDYCLKNPKKSAERFSARFAAREAFFKAFCSMKPNHKIPFLTVCKSIWLESKKGHPPQMHVDWHALSVDCAPKVWISITHTGALATVIAIIETSQHTPLTKESKPRY